MREVVVRRILLIEWVKIGRIMLKGILLMKRDEVE